MWSFVKYREMTMSVPPNFFRNSKQYRSKEENQELDTSSEKDESRFRNFHYGVLGFQSLRTQIESVFYYMVETFRMTLSSRKVYRTEFTLCLDPGIT